MKPQEMRELIKKYLSGNTTSVEKERVEAWFESFEKEDGPLMSDDEKAILEMEIFNRIQGKKRFRAIWVLGARVAASVILVLGVFLFFLRKPEKSAPPVAASVQKNVQLAANTGITKKIMLPDSSTVWLRAGATIEYSPQFNKNNREVVLTGEAFFDVAHNPEKPFIVYAGYLKTQVLGTAFNINSFKSLDHITVSVTRGKVKVSVIKPDQSKEETVVLTPNEQVVYNKHKQVISKEKINAYSIAEWHSEKIIFTDATLTEVAQMLEARFNISISLSEGIAEKKVNGAFEDKDSLGDILEILAQTAGVQSKLVAEGKYEWK